MATFNATGRDIYGQGLTDRLVYQIEAIVRPAMTDVMVCVDARITFLPV